MTNQETKEDKVSEDLRELVLARIGIMPPNFKLALGNKGTFTKDELIGHVSKGDKVGALIIKMELNFIKALSTGKLIEALNQNE